jgi:hypothetical protein
MFCICGLLIQCGCYTNSAYQLIDISNMCEDGTCEACTSASMGGDDGDDTTEEGGEESSDDE